MSLLFAWVWWRFSTKTGENFDNIPPLTEKDVTRVFSNESTPSRHWLCVYSQFKNEKHVLLEWIHHYFQEGADHIFLVDNESDDGFEPSMIRHIPHVTLFQTRIRHRQSDMARFIFKHYVKDRYTWAINLDMDEFLYSRRFPCLSDFLRVQSVENPLRKAWVIPWKSFGSNGHKTQPPNVVHHFFSRDTDFPQAENANLVKTLFQPRYYTLQAHTVVAPSNKKEWESFPHVVMEGGKAPSRKHYRMWHLFDEKTLDLDSADLHLNHYQIQSLDFWTRVKMKRGDADHSGWDHIRTFEYFDKRDKNLVLDKELSMKKQWKKPDLLLFFDPFGSTFASELEWWEAHFQDKVNKIYTVHTFPPYDDVIQKYLLMTNRVLVVCPAHRESVLQFNFVLSRTLLTGRSVYPQPLKGFPTPSPWIFAIKNKTPKTKYTQIPYDEKIVLS
jgi:hypothetical protein